MNRTLLIAAGLALAVPLLTTGAEAEMVLKAGHVQHNDSDIGQAANHFAKRVKELTNGEIEIQVFPDGQLGKSDPAQLESVISGAQDFFVTQMEWYTQWDKRFGVMSTPFVFRDRGHLQTFLKSDLFKDMSKSLEDVGLKFVSTQFNWIRQQDRGVLSRTPVYTPDDLEGMTMRMFQAEMPIKSWSALGANLHVMPWADVYTALATGTVDALTGQIGSIYLAKMTEQLKFFTGLKEYFQPVASVISMKTWEKLTPEQQKLMLQAADETGEVFNRVSASERDEYNRRAMDEHGLKIIQVSLKPWHDKMSPILAEFESAGLLPAGIVAQIRAIK